MELISCSERIHFMFKFVELILISEMYAFTNTLLTYRRVQPHLYQKIWGVICYWCLIETNTRCSLVKSEQFVENRDWHHTVFMEKYQYLTKKLHILFSPRQYTYYNWIDTEKVSMATWLHAQLWSVQHVHIYINGPNYIILQYNMAISLFRLLLACTD